MHTCMHTILEKDKSGLIKGAHKEGNAAYYMQHHLV